MELTPPSDGGISYSQTPVNNAPPYIFRVHTMADFDCDLGFSLSGASTSVCQQSEQWSEQPPTCIRSNENIRVFFLSFFCWIRLI